MDGEVNQELLKKIIVSIVPFVLKLLNISYSDFILEKRFPDFLPCNYVMQFSIKYLNYKNISNNYFLYLVPQYLKTDQEGSYAKFDYHKNRYSLFKKYHYNSDLI